MEYEKGVPYLFEPRTLSRRPDHFGRHPDLKDGEQLIELATPTEVDEALGKMAEALKTYYREEPPVCVPVYRAAQGTMDRLRRINPDFFGDVGAMAVSTTDGQGRRSEPRVTKLPASDQMANRHVLLVDGVLDSGNTLRVGIDAILAQSERSSVSPPRDVQACVAVEKVGAGKYEVPELIAVAMRARKDDWVVGISDGEQRGMDLSDRFAYGLPGVYHIVLP